MNFAPLAFAAVTTTALLVTASNARADSTTYDNQIWAASLNTARLTGRDPSASSGLSAWLEFHTRRTGAGYLSIWRPGLGYRLNRFASVWGGYAFIPSIDDVTREWTVEQRAWQQGLLTVSAADQVTFQLRPRLEQRFREHEDEVAHRARVFVRVNVAPLPKLPVLLATWNETFVHLNDVAWGPRTGFDQNRLFLGFGVRAFQSSRVEIGYLNVTTKRPNDHLVAHNLSVNAFTDF
ncbi:MAG: DUF2490 domain-containing protein [Deltaproteobacteria bacterium]|nr:DUF2490 domain-containing protein [Deltaproteobacteria bacterium]